VAVSVTVAAAVAAAVAAPVPTPVRDFAGKPIAPQERPRIVSVAPAITEILYAIGAGSALVAVSDYCNYPPAAKAMPRIGSLNTLNVEKVVAFHPTLIVSAPGAREQWVHLTRVTRAPVFISQDGGISAILDTIDAMGRVTRHQAQATALGKAIQAKLAALRSANARRTHPRVFYMVWDDPLMSAGNGVYLDDLITKAGGRNAAASAPGFYPRISYEALLADPPDIVIGPGNLKKQVAALAAKVKARRHAIVDEDIASRPGPRVVEALELFEEAIYGDSSRRQKTKP
jgi:iron complex transport system substrate-binding protein